LWEILFTRQWTKQIRVRGRHLISKKTKGVRRKEKEKSVYGRGGKREAYDSKAECPFEYDYVQTGKNMLRQHKMALSCSGRKGGKRGKKGSPRRARGGWKRPAQHSRGQNPGLTTL